MKTLRFVSFGRFPCLVTLFLLLSFSITAQEIARTAPRIAVLDFEVQTENPSYKYLGKGFAEFIAVELSGIKGVTIVDRERRNAIMEEQKFALSGAADEAGNVELGKLLSANYLLSGSLFDMFGQLEVTIRLVDVEKGTAALSAQVGGEPKLYKQIVAELAGKVASSLNIAAAEVPVKVAVAAKPLNNTEADQVLTAFSKAVEAVDNNDIETAKASLKTAQKIDKDNKAVTYYLNKLFSASPKFNVELIYYAPSYNPATLGFIDKDRLYITGSTDLLRPFYVQFPAVEGDDSQQVFNWVVTPGLYYHYYQLKTEIGYYFPLGTGFGLGVEASGGYTASTSRDSNYTRPNRPANEAVFISSATIDGGGRVSLGLKLHDSLALGFSGYASIHDTNLGGTAINSISLNTSASIGLTLRFLNENLTIDSLVTVPFLQEVYIDYDIKNYIAYKTAPYPVVWETSLTGRLLGGRFNLSLKEVLEIYTSFGEDDRTGIASRVIPAVEWWPANFFSVRAGGEYDYLNLMDKITHGFGILGGLSFRIGPADIDINYTYLQRPLRFYAGYSVPDTSLLLQLSWNGAFIKERKK